MIQVEVGDHGIWHVFLQDAIPLGSSQPSHSARYRQDLLPAPMPTKLGFVLKKKKEKKK